MINSRVVLATRKAFLQQIRKSHDKPYSYLVKGSNVPFDVRNPRLLYVKFCLFMATAYWTPYLIVRHHLLKKA